MSAPKTALVLPVRFSHESRAVQTTTRELSEEGVFVRCLEPPPVGAQVGLKIYLPGLAAAAEFVGQVREVIVTPGDIGFWADFVSAELNAHESLLRVLSTDEEPAPGPKGSNAPVPLASLYKRVHPSKPAPGAPVGAPTSAHSNPLHTLPDPAPPRARDSGVGGLIQGSLNRAVSEKAAEALAQRRNTPIGAPTPGARRPTPIASPPPPEAQKPVEVQAPAEAQEPVEESLPAAVAGPPKSAASLVADASNRRTFPRYRARFAVRFSSVQDFVLEYAANISAGGVFVLTDHPPDMNAVITVVMELPDGGAPVVCKALVVHRVTPQQAKERGVEAGVGVQFVEADDQFRERIDHTLAQVLGQAEK